MSDEERIALALAALAEVVDPGDVGALIDVAVPTPGVVDLRFATAMAGYPGWFWTVSTSALEGVEPTVLELELVPGDGALLAPPWVPWADRLAEYRRSHRVDGGDADGDEEGESDLDESADDDEADDLDDADADDEDDAAESEDDGDGDEDDLDIGDDDLGDEDDDLDEDDDDLEDDDEDDEDLDDDDDDDLDDEDDDLDEEDLDLGDDDDGLDDGVDVDTAAEAVDDGTASRR